MRSARAASSKRRSACVAEVDRLRRQLRGVDGDPADAALVIAEAAGILAAWSLAIEGEQPGALAQAARQLGRAAERPAHQRTPPARRRPRGSLLAGYLPAGARPDSAAAWYLLGRQLALLGADVARLHQARGRAQRTQHLEAGRREALDRVRTDVAATESSPSVELEARTAAELRRLQEPTQPECHDPSQGGRDAEAARRLTAATRRRPPRRR